MSWNEMKMLETDFSHWSAPSDRIRDKATYLNIGNSTPVYKNFFIAMVRVAKHLHRLTAEADRMRELELVNTEKRRSRGDLEAADFQDLKGTQRKGGKGSLHM